MTEKNITWSFLHFFFLLHPQITCYIFVFRSNFSFRCEPANFSTDSKGMFIAYLSYSYFILKLTDYCDTVFFILRKKWTHVSFLHVYHHLLVSVGTYLWVLYAPGLKTKIYGLLWFSLGTENFESDRFMDEFDFRLRNSSANWDWICHFLSDTEHTWNSRLERILKNVRIYSWCHTFSFSIWSVPYFCR